MRVLLVGEFSGFYLNLKQGLQELGVDVTLAANGDGWKQIPGADIPLFRTGDKNKLKKIYYISTHILLILTKRLTRMVRMWVEYTQEAGR